VDVICWRPGTCPNCRSGVDRVRVDRRDGAEPHQVDADVPCVAVAVSTGTGGGPGAVALCASTCVHARMPQSASATIAVVTPIQRARSRGEFGRSSPVGSRAGRTPRAATTVGSHALGRPRWMNRCTSNPTMRRNRRAAPRRRNARAGGASRGGVPPSRQSAERVSGRASPRSPAADRAWCEEGAPTVAVRDATSSRVR
jgi:hypothetical protein